MSIICHIWGNFNGQLENARKQKYTGGYSILTCWNIGSVVSEWFRFLILGVNILIGCQPSNSLPNIFLLIHFNDNR